MVFFSIADTDRSHLRIGALSTNKGVSIAIYFLNTQNFEAGLAIIRFAGNLGLSHIIFDEFITNEYENNKTGIH